MGHWPDTARLFLYSKKESNCLHSLWRGIISSDHLLFSPLCLFLNYESDRKYLFCVFAIGNHVANMYSCMCVLQRHI